ncbi:hypothetical protein [Pinirhizobacter sp.]|jgi:hypothetical protein|uniref:hypothetical protein n=1 Tax=Pinirhizobacter sp. TaxID=2950432 RepID=UPI002F42C046
MLWHDKLALLVHMGDQRKQAALLLAAKASKQSEEKLDEARELRQDMASPPPRLMPEFQLDRPRLFARLRSVAVMQAHRAEVELHARALEDEAASLQEQAVQRWAEVYRHHARREKFEACRSRMEHDRRRDRARREEIASQEAFVCQV